MAFYIDSTDKQRIFDRAETLSGVTDKAELADVLFAAVVADVSAYTNQDFEFLEPPEFYKYDLPTDREINIYLEDYNGQTEPATTCPRQIMDGVFVPMLAARLAAGMQSVSTVSEGGSSASVKQTYSPDVADYAAVLCRYKRLGYPRKAGAV